MFLERGPRHACRCATQWRIIRSLLQQKRRIIRSLLKQKRTQTCVQMCDTTTYYDVSFATNEDPDMCTDVRHNDVLLGLFCNKKDVMLGLFCNKRGPRYVYRCATQRRIIMCFLQKGAKQPRALWRGDLDMVTYGRRPNDVSLGLFCNRALVNSGFLWKQRLGTYIYIYIYMYMCPKRLIQMTCACLVHVCDMTTSCMCDMTTSFICVIWLPHSYLWNEYLIYMCGMTTSFIRVAWLYCNINGHTWRGPRSYVWHDYFAIYSDTREVGSL